MLVNACSLGAAAVFAGLPREVTAVDPHAAVHLHQALVGAAWHQWIRIFRHALQSTVTQPLPPGRVCLTESVARPQ